MGKHLNYGGLVVAGLGFFLTRFTVTLALYDDTVQFYLAGVVPLALGLGLAAFGVALAVADVDGAMVRTTTIWAVIGFATMAVLVGLTLAGSTADGRLSVEVARTRTYLSNFLIGGSIGGTLTGLYAARNRRQRGVLREQTNRLVTINRLLRHEVLNAVSVIRGYASVDPEEHPNGMSVIDKRAADIQQTIEEVRYFTNSSGGNGPGPTPRDLGADLHESIATIGERYPDVDVSVESVPDDVTVFANERLGLVFTNLLENAVVHGEDRTPAVTVETTPATVAVSITDDGSGLPESQRALLETGDIDEFDNPKVGFGLNVVRLLVTSYGGNIDTAVDDSTTVTVTLSRAQPQGVEVRPSRSDLAGVRPAAPHLVVACAAALVAGVAYSVVSGFLGGSVAGIGVFYGTADPVVGWLTHEFHSVVFGFTYVGVLSLVLERYRNTTATYAVVGVVWGLLVWAVAASVVAPVWLQLLGIPTSVPNFSLPLLASHLVWGVTLGLGTALGYTYVMPRLGESVE
ncbi:ATP-binding protein [Halolamina litorea]|uniref:histidine kinase n=1 Tax=Halolamina litorea TaxID=1515593 RepID=A0ABD6BL99_9EURY|nr:HAMP domain-containing sensor histidine kinase [Halolamina litorea]